MNKLRLNPEDLQVQSFQTDEAARERGTVHGHETLEANLCNQTVEATCAQGCGTETGSLSACGCETAECTGNAGDMYCYDSYNYCLETQRPLHTCPFCLP